MLLQYILTKEQHADILTKALSRGKFKFHRCRIWVVDNPFLTMMRVLRSATRKYQFDFALVKLRKNKFPH